MRFIWRMRTMISNAIQNLISKYNIYFFLAKQTAEVYRLSVFRQRMFVFTTTNSFTYLMYCPVCFFVFLCAGYMYVYSVLICCCLSSPNHCLQWLSFYTFDLASNKTNAARNIEKHAQIQTF